MKKAILILLFFGLLNSALADDLPIPKHYSRGEDYTGQDIQYLEKAVQISPDNFGTYYGLGIAYYLKGDYEKVIECRQKFVQFIKPDYKQASRKLEIAYKKIKNYPTLEPYFQKSSTFTQEDEEIEALARALSINPRVADIYVYFAGLTPASQESLSEEIQYLEKALQIYPNNFGTLYGLGVAYYRMRDYNKALECLVKFIQINPHWCDLVYFGLAVVYNEKGDLDKVTELINELQSLGGNDLIAELQEVGVVPNSDIQNDNTSKQAISGPYDSPFYKFEFADGLEQNY